MTLSRDQARLHRQAEQLIALRRDLREHEQQFVLENWQESASTEQVLDGAFFTPLSLARCVASQVVGDRLIDLGAGIGGLSWVCRDRREEGLPPCEVVCVEKNPEYVRVGRKVLPDATWMCADILRLDGMDLGGPFDTAISNPPFGRITRSGNAPRYTGGLFEFHAIAVAAQLASYGAFIIPQTSAPFRTTQQRVIPQQSPPYERFTKESGITLETSQGSFDTSFAAGEWRGAVVRTELANFSPS